MNGYALTQRLEKIMTDAEPKGYGHVAYGIKYKVWDQVAQPVREIHRTHIVDIMLDKIDGIKRNLK